MKLVRECLIEKFIEDSDPIKDMGIGSKWKLIKRGDILKGKSKKKISSKDLKLFSSSYIFYFENINKILNNGVIYDIDNSTDMLSLNIITFDKIEYSLSIQNRIQNKSIYFSGEEYIKTLVSAPIEIWEKYFYIYEKNS